MAGPGNNIEHRKVSGKEIFLAAVTLVAGILMIVMTPLGAGYDEDQHFFRVWQLSDLEMIPREMPARQARFPELYIDLSYRRQPLVGSVGFDYWEKYGHLQLYDYGYHYGPISTRSRYSPALLLPQALVVRYLGRKAGLPALLLYNTTRFAGLLSYLVLVWLALRVIPYGKWMLLVLALSPAAIYQAATISADTISNGIGLLFVGACLGIREKKELTWQDWGRLAFLIFLLFLTKPNLFPLILLPFLAIKPSDFQNKFAYPLLAAAAVVLFAVEFMGWNIATSGAALSASGEVNPIEQIRFIASNPLDFATTIVQDLFLQGRHRLVQWIATYGYEYGQVPGITYLLFAAGLGAALLIKTEEKRPDKRVRIALVISFVAAYLATVVSLYIAFTAVGGTYVYGFQGRYLIPVFPLLLLALYDLSFLRRFQGNMLITGTCVVAALAAFVTGLILSFHVTCGITYYSRGLCYQPFYKNFSPTTRSSPPISGEVTLMQEVIPVCDGMSRIQIRVNSPGQSQNGQTEFIFRDVSQNIILVEETVRNNALPADSWYPMDFAAQPKSAGKLYTITIRGTETGSRDDPLLAYSIRPEYPAGTLYQNGEAVEDDLLFQYGCVTGLERILQAGK